MTSSNLFKVSFFLFFFNTYLKYVVEQVTKWKGMYDALAKLYTPLRNEYLELLRKYKQMQLKAASAQEAIDRRDKLEREMKSKNLELADMIRERDRALYDLDRVRGVSSSPPKPPFSG